MNVCVITDSSAVMVEEVATGLPLRRLALEIAWADGTVDRGDRPYTVIADRLATQTVPPKTGAPSPGLIAELVSEALQSHDGVLVICPASDLSSTYASARLGARDLPSERVRVLDSKTAAAGQGLVAVEAARSAARGDDLDAVTARASFVASRVQVWATLSQLVFMRRSGRIPAIAAVGADALNLQPIVRYTGGSPAPVAVTRSEARAAERIFRAWERSIVTNAQLHAVAFYSSRGDDASDLVARIGERVPGAEVGSIEVTASLASHTGPGLLGLAWFWDN